MLRNIRAVLIASFAIGYGVPVAAQVPDVDVRRYLNSFSERPRPTAQPRIDYRSLVATQNQKTGWFVGQWTTPDGFIAGYPSKVADTICLVTHTPRSSAFAIGTRQGDYLRTSTPLFLSPNERFLEYVGDSVFVPVIYRGNAYLGWGIADRTAGRSRFLTLAFRDRPPDPTSFLTPGKTADAIKAQLQAAGCWRAPQVNLPGQVTQTIRGITSIISPLTQTSTSRTYRVQFINNTTEAFGAMPNRFLAFDANNRRIPSSFTSLLHGIVAQPGGIIEGTITVFRPTVGRISVVEATPGGRRFDLSLAR